MCAGITPEYFAKTQPTLHVGVMPVPALTTSAIDNVTNNNSFTDAQAYFEITCEMEVECALRFTQPFIASINCAIVPLPLPLYIDESTSACALNFLFVPNST